MTTNSSDDAVRRSYLRHLLPLVIAAVVGWAVFLVIFQHFFPNDYDATESRAVLWGWLAVSTAAFIGTMFATFRLARTPPEWRASAAIAMLAPALVLDAVATTFFRDWFPDSAPGEPAAYAATILGGVGVMQLVAVLYHRPSRRATANDTDR